jgi:hypothetical protein
MAISRAWTNTTLLIAAGLAVAAGPAGAAPDRDAAGPGPGPAPEVTIVGGQAASTCQWPTTVALFGGGGLCTGTLVHPRLILYAAHCGTSFNEATFGENLGGMGVPIERCQRNSGIDQVGPHDYAFCVLAQAVDRVPLTPVLYGCEGDNLTTGRQVAIAGFGEDENENAGVKRWAMTQISGFDSGMIVVGGGGTSAWFGDSGGPAYIQLDDGGWRAFGIVSGGPGPGQGVYYVDMRTVVSWVEQNSGIDITPCHDVDGSWNPSAACGGYATAPTQGDSWADFCGRNDPRTLPSTTCGSFEPDETPPQVRIVSPADGTEIDEAPSQVIIEVDAQDDRGVRRVRLAVNGEELQELSTEPYRVTGTFPKGTYRLVAQAEDTSGNTAQSSVHEIFIGERAGCLCSSTSGAPGWGAAALAALLLLSLRALWRPTRSRGSRPSC